MSDEGFHEIQLNGKQLIFLSMTVTVILVVVFLSGVLVGRGVKTAKDQGGEVVAAATPAEEPAGAGASTVSPPTPIAPQLTTTSPKAWGDDISFPAALPAEAPPSDTAPAAPAAKTPAASPTAAAPATPAPAAPAVAPAAGDPPGRGYLVKVVAYSNRTQAEALVTRLLGAGYKAYLVPVTSKNSTVYSVRVGRYPNRRQAEAARRRLEKEERLKPSLSR
jgi:cell division septation protein DedD